VQDGSGVGCKLCYGKLLSLQRHLENRWLKEGVDFVGEREHGPRHAQNEQNQTSNQSTNKMEVEQDHANASVTDHPFRQSILNGILTTIKDAAN